MRLDELSCGELGQRTPDSLRPGEVFLGSDCVERIEFVGCQPDRDHLHRFGPAPGASAPTSCEFLDVVSGLGFVGPTLDLFFGHHGNIV